MQKPEDKDVFIRITNKEIYSEIKKMHETTQGILEQAKKTNGRVTKLENTSTGLWVSTHPIKFAIALLIFSGLFISDSREVIVTLLKGLI